MTLEQQVKDMRAAIDAMEIAMMGFGDIVDLPGKWGEPRHRDGVGVLLTVTAGQVYQVTSALAELTRIINSPEYEV